jgi:hypothetical protein
VSGSCTIPVTAAILDALNITNCQTISTLTTAKFYYYYDSNGDGLDNDGGTWTFFSNGTPTGTTVTGSLDVSTLLRGHYLIAIELTDGALPSCSRGSTPLRHSLPSSVRPMATSRPQASARRRRA